MEIIIILAPMGENGRRFVVEPFTWERVIEELFQVYKEILTGRRQSPPGGRRLSRVARRRLLQPIIRSSHGAC